MEALQRHKFTLGKDVYKRQKFNVELIEKHHTAKLDSPSGTAILLADKVSAACKEKKNYLYGRHGKDDKFEMTDLGIHAVRGGTIPGEHTVIYAGPDEVIELKHKMCIRDRPRRD